MKRHDLTVTDTPGVPPLSLSRPLAPTGEPGPLARAEAQRAPRRPGLAVFSANSAPLRGPFRPPPSAPRSPWGRHETGGAIGRGTAEAGPGGIRGTYRGARRLSRAFIGYLAARRQALTR